MKKFNLIRPCLNLAFGILLVLSYLNLLSAGNEWLAVGIIALIFGIGYIGYGLVSFFLNEKLPPVAKDIGEVATVGLYPLFMFVVALINVIDFNAALGPSGWIIVLFVMITGLALPVILCLFWFLKKKALRLFVFLSAGLFVLALLLLILFDVDGDPTNIGAISLVELFMDGIFGGILFFSFLQNKARFLEEPKAETSPEGGSDPEPVPAEEPENPEPAPEEPSSEQPAPEDPKPEEAE